MVLTRWQIIYGFVMINYKRKQTNEANINFKTQHLNINNINF